METHQYLLNLQLKLSQRLLMAPPLQHPQEDWDRELIWSSISNCEALFSTWFSYRIPSPALPCFLLREAGPLSSLLWILLINFCICWVFCLPSFLPSFQAFSSCKKWGLNSRCCAQASHCGHFSYCRTWALEHRLHCSVACWIFQDHIEAVSLALAGGSPSMNPQEVLLMFYLAPS